MANYMPKVEKEKIYYENREMTIFKLLGPGS